MAYDLIAQAYDYSVVCRGVTKEYYAGGTPVHALRGIDMHVAAGELTLLAGPSGCGKTTLVSIISGLLSPSAGEIIVLGTELSKLSSSELGHFRRDHMGFVFQQYNLLPALTAAENAALPLLILGVARRDAIGHARRLLEELGIGEKTEALPAQLSGGQQQRVAIARAIVHEPRLLVCDEPTAALDAEAGRNVMRLIGRSTVRADRAVIVVTHDDRVFPFANRILTIEDGRIVHEQVR